jgi:hypothetical protein
MDELDGDDSYNYRWSNAISAMFTEVPQILTLFNLRSYRSDLSLDIMGYLCTPGSQLNSYISTLINECLIPNNRSILNLYAPKSVTVRDTWQNYSAHAEFLNMLPLMGVSVDLVSQDSTNTLSFYDIDFANPKNPSANGARHLKAESAMGFSTGLSMSELVRTALEDYPLARERLSELKTHAWATAKAQVVSGVVKQLNHRNNRLLVLAEHPTLFRNLCLQTRSDTLKPNDLLDTTRARYVHPDESWRSYGLAEIPAPVNTLVLQNLDLVDQRVLEATTHLVVAEWPHDQYLMLGLRELCEALSIRLVHVTLLNTFEQTLQDSLFRG